MVKLVGCAAVWDLMKENSAAGTHSVTLLSVITFLAVLWGGKKQQTQQQQQHSQHLISSQHTARNKPKVLP
jgi:hypothetical protein